MSAAYARVFTVIKKANSTTTLMTTTEIFKCYKNSMLFDAQNTENYISELLDFKFFWGMPPDPPRGNASCGPLVVTATCSTKGGCL